MAAPRKPQTEKKAKGLIGREKGKKVEGAPYSVGNYKGRTLNLTNKQLGKKGRAAAAVRGGKPVNIQNTRYDAAQKRVLGPKGNPLTGRVDLGGGNFAVYVDGRRVRAQKPKPPKPSTGSGSGGGSGSTTMTAQQKREARKNAKSWGDAIRRVNAREKGKAAARVYGKAYQAAAQAQRNRPGNKPQEGQTRRVARGSGSVYQVYKSGRWVDYGDLFGGRAR